MIKIQITDDALISLLTPGNDALECVNGLPQGVTLYSVLLNPIGIISLLFDDGKEEVCEMKPKFIRPEVKNESLILL